MKLMKWLAPVALLCIVAVAWATPPPDADWQYVNGGMVRTHKLLFHTGDSLSVNNQDAYEDSALLIQDQHDTTKFIPISGAKSIRSWHKIRAYNDTARVRIYIQVSPDTALASKLTATLSTSFVTGFSNNIADGDTIVTKLWYLKGDTLQLGRADRDLLASARFARFIYRDSTNALDSVEVGNDYVQIEYEADPNPRSSPKK